MKREKIYLDRVDKAIERINALPVDALSRLDVSRCALSNAMPYDGHSIPKSRLVDESCFRCAIGHLGAWCLAPEEVATNPDELVDAYKLVEEFYGLTLGEVGQIYQVNDGAPAHSRQYSVASRLRHFRERAAG